MCTVALYLLEACCVDTTVHAFCVAGNLEIKGLQASCMSFPCLAVAASLWSMGASQSSVSAKHFDPPAEW